MFGEEFLWFDEAPADIKLAMCVCVHSHLPDLWRVARPSLKWKDIIALTVLTVACEKKKEP